MPTDLLDRDALVSSDPSSSVRRRTRVVRVFAGRSRSGAWAYLDGVGWRRVAAPTPAGSRDLLASLCRARLTGVEVTAEITGTTVVAAGQEHSESEDDLHPESRLTGSTKAARRRPAPEHL